MEFNKETQTLKETQTSKETQTLKRYMEFNKETQTLKNTEYQYRDPNDIKRPKPEKETHS